MSTTILIIDDEPDIVKVLSFWLEANGYEVIFSHLGREGASLAEEKKPAVILLDFILPDISGSEVLDLLKVNPKVLHIPVILMSASAESLKEEGTKSRVAEAILKPMDHKKLLESIQRYTE